MSRDENGVWIADEESESASSSIGDVSDIEDISEQIRKKPKKKIEDEDTSVKQFRTKRKGWIKWVVIGVIAAAVIGFVVYKSFETKKKLQEALAAGNTNTAEITRMDLSKAISTTGTIRSKDIRTITSPLAGVKIEEVNCKVGDMVQAGDIVVTFSREDINKKIGQLEEDIVEANKVKGLDAGDRNNTHVNKTELETYNIATSYEDLQRKADDLHKAEDDLRKACDDTAKYRAKYQEAKDNVGGLKSDLEHLQVFYQDWKATKTKEISTGKLVPDTEEYTIYIAQDVKYSNDISAMQSKITEYESTIKGYDSSLDSYLKLEKTAQNSLDTAQRSFDDAYVKFNKSQYDASFNDAKYDYDYNRGNVKANDDVKTLERQKEEKVDSLDNYIITAPISGVVTEVNAQEGNGYQATTGALMTIQAVDVYEVTTQVDEYDINNVVVGQEVAIMTDATGDDEFKGKVTFIAPIATSSSGSGNATASSGSGSTTFEVKIDILDKDQRLRLGMSAKLNILIDTHKNVLAVPYDAIEEKDGGQTVIYVVDKNAEDSKKKPESGLDITIIGKDGLVKDDDKDKPGEGDKTSGFGGKPANTKEIPVQIGLESDYYTEVISNQISEGMTVVINSSAGEIKGDMSMFMGM